MQQGKLGRFFKNAIGAIGHCMLEDAELVVVAVPVMVLLAGLGSLFLLAVSVYSLLAEPHWPTLASLALLSINPDKWI